MNELAYQMGKLAAAMAPGMVSSGPAAPMGGIKPAGPINGGLGSPLTGSTMSRPAPALHSGGTTPAMAAAPEVSLGGKG